MNNNKDKFTVGGPKALYVMIICSLCYLMDYMDRQVMGVLLQPIKVEFGLSDFEAGLLPAVLVLGVIVFVFPTAHFVDRWSRKKMIAVLVAFWSSLRFSPDRA
jgi:MFS family permease